jgi:hypothetical protein
VWLWLREHGLKFPLPRNRFDSFTEPIRWVEPTYHAVHKVLTHPAYAGAYVFGNYAEPAVMPSGTPNAGPGTRTGMQSSA